MCAITSHTQLHRLFRKTIITPVPPGATPMPYAYAGRYIRIDLTTGQHSVEAISDEDVKTYLLGSGYAARLFYEEMAPALDPLDPRATLYVFNGLLAGTFAPTGCPPSLWG